MKLVKISIEIDGKSFTASLMESFGVIPVSELHNVDAVIESELPNLDYGDWEYGQCEGYAEITFQLSCNGDGYDWSVIDSMYHDLM